MSVNAFIEYCDSTCNLLMGCPGGCELWSSKRRSCYAGVMTGKYAGQKGWPKSFAETAIFPKRMDEALRWSDLRGYERAEKPWLNGYPRIVFLNDMSDTFSEGLALDWLSPYVPAMAAAPHIWLLFTKRASRMVEFFTKVVPAVPTNFWLLTSITSQSTLPRARKLLELRERNPGAVLGLSVEPLLGPVDLAALGGPGLAGLSWVIGGGESGEDARPMSPIWIRSLVDSCAAANVPFFFKQLGAYLYTRIGGGKAIRPDGDILLDAYEADRAVHDDPNTYFFRPVGRTHGGAALGGIAYTGMPPLPARAEQLALLP